MGKKLARLEARITKLEEGMADLLRGALNHPIKTKKRAKKAAAPKKAAARKAAPQKIAAKKPSPPQPKKPGPIRAIAAASMQRHPPVPPAPAAATRP